MPEDEKLIKEAAIKIDNDAWLRADDFRSLFGRPFGLTEQQDRKDAARGKARAVLAVFEKAHTPTDDELTSEQRHTLVEGAVDAIEPNATNRTHAYNIWNNIASDERFVRAIMTLVSNRGQSEPQGEPSDAEVQAAAHALSEWLNDNAPIGEAMYREPARAALRAAGGVR